MTLRAISNGTAGRDDGSDPDPERRRNKLGYQRISVACAHCRRRKIRCVVHAKETSGKCTNCIRLRRACEFYPVDHLTTSQNVAQAEAARAQMNGHLVSSSHRAGRAQRSPNSSSMSPASSGGTDGSVQNRDIDMYARAPQTLARPQPYPSLMIEPSSSMHPSGYVHPEYDYRAGGEDYMARYNAPTGFHPTASSSHAQSGPDPYWRATENTVLGGYGSFPPITQPAMRPPYPPAANNGAAQPAQPWHQSRAQSPRSSLYQMPGHQESTIGNAYTYAPTAHADPGVLAGPVRHNSVTYAGSTVPMAHPSERIRAASDAGSHMSMVYSQVNGGHAQPEVTTSLMYASQPAYAGPWYDQTANSNNNNGNNNANGNGNGNSNGTMPPGMYPPRSG